MTTSTAPRNPVLRLIPAREDRTTPVTVVHHRRLATTDRAPDSVAHLTAPAPLDARRWPDLAALKNLYNDLDFWTVKIFISWSGARSREVAVAIRDWLPGVINSAKPFVSSKDIYAGSRWQMEIASQLESTNFGIVCVTRENQAAPWLNFEAGALAKVVESSAVVPLAIDLKPSDIQLPLAQFQAQPASYAGVEEILSAINAVSPDPLTDQLLKRACAKWWPDLETEFKRIEQSASSETSITMPARSDRELLEEVLDSVRSLARAMPDSVERVPASERSAFIRNLVEFLQSQDDQAQISVLGPWEIKIATNEPLATHAKRTVTTLATREGVKVSFSALADDRASSHVSGGDAEDLMT